MQIEILAWPHQLAVLQARRRKSSSLGSADRLLAHAFANRYARIERPTRCVQIVAGISDKWGRTNRKECEDMEKRPKLRGGCNPRKIKNLGF
ncbi:MAG: hypothetical protein ACR2HX_09020 [Pyrinomonadaceae bacterium]